MSKKSQPPDHSDLLALWERCPDTAPKFRTWGTRGGSFFIETMGGTTVYQGSDNESFDAIACAAMERWLHSHRDGVLILQHLGEGEVFEVSTYTEWDAPDDEDGRIYTAGPTKLSALIAAVRAVAGTSGKTQEKGGPA